MYVYNLPIILSPWLSILSLLLCSVHTTVIACLSVLEEKSLLCCSSWVFLHSFPVKGVFGEVVLIKTKDLSIEGVECFSDCTLWNQLVCTVSGLALVAVYVRWVQAGFGLCAGSMVPTLTTSLWWQYIRKLHSFTATDSCLSRTTKLFVFFLN